MPTRDSKPADGSKPRPVPNPDLGADDPENPVVYRPAMPAETFGQRSPFEDMGAVTPGGAEDSMGSID